MSFKIAPRRLCTYIIGQDLGLAPNPFWGWCTFAVCTPNHQGARLIEGDWIAGFSSRGTGNLLIYAMQVFDRIHMDSYFNDPRFADKKPNQRGTWQQRCGDNFYSQNPDSSWKQHWNPFHPGKEYTKKDTRKPYVFVSNRFWYFGRDAVSVPEQYKPLIGERGIRVNHRFELTENFLGWVESSHKQGVRALPRDNPDRPRSP